MFGNKTGYNRIVVGLVGALFSGTTLAAVQIEQTPLFVTENADPNMLFVMDDSGSMQFESMPDELTNLFAEGCCDDYVMWMFPFVNGVHGGSSYGTRRVPSFSSDSIMAAVYRSAYTNTLYYNPAVTYEPWARADGSLMPDADPENADHNPSFPGRGDRDLTRVDDDEYAEWMDDRVNDEDREERDFYPATYFHYTGPKVDSVPDAIEDGSSAVWEIDNYSRTRIRSSKNSYTGEGRSNRSDCSNGTCTYEQEIQNFANWYTYYRSRVFAARAGIGRAFSDQRESLRVGYGAINERDEREIDGANSTTVIRGVRPFTGDDREDFFTNLYEQTIDPEGTPLRQGLQGAGEYFRRTDGGSPWTDDPTDHSVSSDDGDDSGGGLPDFICRIFPQFCDDDDDAQDDEPEDESTSVACRQSFTVLMTDGYWSGGDPDNIGNVDNQTGPQISEPNGESYRYSPADPYRDSYSNTLADVAMRYWSRDLQPDLENAVPTSKRDEAFWQHMVTYSIGLGVEGDVSRDAALSAAASGGDVDWGNPFTSQSAKIDDLLHAGLNGRGGSFSAANPEEFATELASGLEGLLGRITSTAASLAATSTQASGETSVFQAAFRTDDWSGEVVSYPYLAVGDADAEEWRASEQIPSAGSRNIWSYQSGGVAFQWNSLDSAAQQALGSSNVLNYIRGSDANEGTGTDEFRQRDILLGDIVHSTPAFIGEEDYGYGILPSAAGSAYGSFIAGKSSRTDIILVGANDGMLHAFNADTGAELFAYVPRQLFGELDRLTEQDYSHRYYVDGSPAVGDAYLDGSWRTVAVTALGRGGRGLFALDVTNPTGFGSGDVLWELSAEDAGVLGEAMGQPAVVRLESGDWVALVGNGYNSDNGTAALVVLDLETGEVLKEFDTQLGGDNGLAAPAAVDRDRNGSVDAVYAGDLKGNLWKFDLSADSPAQWNIAYGGAPLVTTEADSGNAQPITARPDVIAHPKGGVMVVFGTGRYLADEDVEQTDEQSVYGVWDREGATAADGTELTDSRVSGLSELVEQTTVVVSTNVGNRDVRVLSDNAVNYDNESGGNKRGWYFDLVRQGERVVRDLTIFDGKAIFVSTIPEVDSCTFGGDSAFFEINPLTGTQFNEPILDLNDDGEFDDGDSTTVDMGDGEGGTKVYPGIVDLDLGLATNPYILNKTDGNQAKIGTGSNLETENLSEKGFIRPGRASWLQLR